MLFFLPFLAHHIILPIGCNLASSSFRQWLEFMNAEEREFLNWKVFGLPFCYRPYGALIYFIFFFNEIKQSTLTTFYRTEQWKPSCYFKQGWRNKDTLFQIEFHKFVIWRISTKLTSGSRFYALLNIYSALTLNL